MTAVRPGRTDAPRPITIGDGRLSLDDYLAVTVERRAVRLGERAVVRMREHRASLLRQLDRGTRIYGVNTGYGADSTSMLAPPQIRSVQRGTLLSHAVGTGPSTPPEVVRGMLLLKASVLAQGHSAVRPELAALLVEFLNHDILPVVPEQGSLAASGDLVPCGHVGLALLGEGEVTVRGGRLSARQALAEAGLRPLEPEAKEGLALVNGTSFTAAYALATALRAQRLLQAADVAAAATLQGLKGCLAAFQERALRVRPFPGALLVAENVRRLCAASPLLEQPPTRVHDPYSLRCVPQVHGASRDAFRYVEEALLIELNSCTDNPLIFDDDDACVSAGNFHAQPVAIPMDTLAILVTELAAISQRRTQQLVAPVYDVGLRLGLTAGSGQGLGLFMLNTTASALVSENRTLCFPASVDSMAVDTTEDHTSMGSIAARKAMQIVLNTAHALALELICACQALDLHSPLRPSPPIDRVRGLVRETVPFVSEDRSLSPEIGRLAERLLAGDLEKCVEGSGVTLA